MSDAINILLVEDNKADADLMKELIIDTGFAHKLTILDDGEKATAYLDGGERPDFILLDLNLPKANGHQIVKSLREMDINTEVPVIIMTGSTSPKDLEQAKQNGVVCYLVKPMDLEEMDRTTRQLIEIFSGRKKCNCQYPKGAGEGI